MQPSPRPLSGPHLAMGAVTFIGELLLWAGAGRLAYVLTRPAGPTVGMIAGAGAAVVFMVGWSLFLAPRAVRRLAAAGRIAVIVLCALGIVAGLAVLGDGVAALIVLGAGAAVIAGQFLLRER